MSASLPMSLSPATQPRSRRSVGSSPGPSRYAVPLDVWYGFVTERTQTDFYLAFRPPWGMSVSRPHRLTPLKESCCVQPGSQTISLRWAENSTRIAGASSAPSTRCPASSSRKSISTPASTSGRRSSARWQTANSHLTCGSGRECTSILPPVPYPALS